MTVSWELFKHADLLAARRGVSLSKLLRQLLEQALDEQSLDDHEKRMHPPCA